MEALTATPGPAPTPAPSGTGLPPGDPFLAAQKQALLQRLGNKGYSPEEAEGMFFSQVGGSANMGYAEIQRLNDLLDRQG